MNRLHPLGIGLVGIISFVAGSAFVIGVVLVLKNIGLMG